MKHVTQYLAQVISPMISLLNLATSAFNSPTITSLCTYHIKLQLFILCFLLLLEGGDHLFI